MKKNTPLIFAMISTACLVVSFLCLSTRAEEATSASVAPYDVYMDCYKEVRKTTREKNSLDRWVMDKGLLIEVGDFVGSVTDDAGDKKRGVYSGLIAYSAGGACFIPKTNDMDFSNLFTISDDRILAGFAAAQKNDCDISNDSQNVTYTIGGVNTKALYAKKPEKLKRVQKKGSQNILAFLIGERLTANRQFLEMSPETAEKYGIADPGPTKAQVLVNSKQAITYCRDLAQKTIDSGRLPSQPYRELLSELDRAEKEIDKEIRSMNKIKKHKVESDDEKSDGQTIK